VHTELEKIAECLLDSLGADTALASQGFEQWMNTALPLLGRLFDVMDAEPTEAAAAPAGAWGSSTADAVDDGPERIYNDWLIFFSFFRVGQGGAAGGVTPALLAQMVPAICDEICSDGANKSGALEKQLRFKLLTELYTTLPPDSVHRCAVYTRIAQYAVEAGCPENVEANVEMLRSLVAEWGASLEEQRVAYLATHAALEASDRLLEAQAMLVSYLRHSGALAEQPAAAQIAVLEAALLSAIRAPLTASINQFELLSLPYLAAKRAAGSTSCASDTDKAVRLFTIFGVEDLPAYLAFHGDATNAAWMGSKHISHETCLEKARLLALTGLASSAKMATAIPYSTIAAALQIEMDEVESWVVRATTAGVIRAKMDQLDQTVSISKSTQRVFDASQWNSLGDKLQNWNTSVSELANAVEHARLQHASLAAAN